MMLTLEELERTQPQTVPTKKCCEDSKETLFRSKHLITVVDEDGLASYAYQDEDGSIEIL